MARPKRKITTRCLEYNGGMLHEEEVALRRALQASLLASKTTTQQLKTKNSNTIKEGEDDSPAIKDKDSLPSKAKGSSKSVFKSTDKQQKVKSIKRKSQDSNDVRQTKRQKKLFVQVLPKGSSKRRGNMVGSKEKKKQKVTSVKEKKNVKDKLLKKGLRKRKFRKHLGNSMEVTDQKNITDGPPRIVHAQRKFAQTNASSPRSMLLYQKQIQPLKTRAKTEDFLDFLCLRGTGRLPKSLELFNNPCAPLSPLTDDEESNKNSTPSKIQASEKAPQSLPESAGESSAKRSLNLPISDQPCSVSSSSSGSSVSSPVSNRVQPHAVLPQFTNEKTNYGVLTHIPTPIPYPYASHLPLTPPRILGLDAYGSPSRSVPSSLSYHPPVSSVPMGMHRVPSCTLEGKEGFCPVNQRWPPSPSQGAMSGNSRHGSARKVNNNRNSKCPKKTGRKDQSKSPDKKISRTTGSSNKVAVENNETTPRDLLRSFVEKQGDAGVAVGHVLEDVPLFMPTEAEFKNPSRYIESIRSRAEPFGICAVVPPDSWKPDCCLSEEVRFCTKQQYIHRLGNRSSPVEREVKALKKHLEQQGITLAIMPQIAGFELDLPYMSKVINDFGGLQQIIDKRKWSRVADTLRIPKTTVERSGKLEQIYCKYLLSFDLLSEEERKKLYESVEEDITTQSDSVTKCGCEFMSKGRSMTLSFFQRTAKNVMEHHTKSNADSKEVEKMYWRIIDDGQRYVVVHSAEIPNTAFPTSKGIPFSKSKWNLSVLPKASGSALRDLTGVEGISSPLVKVEMMLSTALWQTFPHALFTMEYLHQGSEKIWYSIPSNSKGKFLEVVQNQFGAKTCDIPELAISPSSLLKAGVPVYEVPQEQGQFIIRFPGAYHYSISSGYAISESVAFAPLSQLQQIKASFQSSTQLQVEHLFSWESLILSSVKEELHRNSSGETLKIFIPELEELRTGETVLREELLKYGVIKKLRNQDNQGKECSSKSRRRRFELDEMETCDVCNRFCFLSEVSYESNRSLCLEHALVQLRQGGISSDDMTLLVHFDMSELEELVSEARQRLDELQNKPKPQLKFKKAVKGRKLQS